MAARLALTPTLSCSQLDEEDDDFVDASSALKHDRRFTWRMLRLFEREDLHQCV